MVKLLLIGLGLFVFSCDSSSPTEVTTEVLVDSVCGYDDFEYLSGCGSIFQGCYAYGVDGLAVIADGYCVMAGYTNAVSYDVIITGPVQNVLNIGCNNSEDNPDYYSCDFVGYCNETNQGTLGVSDSCPVMSNLVCE